MGYRGSAGAFNKHEAECWDLGLASRSAVNQLYDEQCVSLPLAKLQQEAVHSFSVGTPSFNMPKLQTAEA